MVFKFRKRRLSTFFHILNCNAAIPDLKRLATNVGGKISYDLLLLTSIPMQQSSFGLCLYEARYLYYGSILFGSLLTALLVKHYAFWVAGALYPVHKA